MLKSIYDSHFDHFAYDTAQIRSIRYFSMQEFSNALRNMSLNKAADQDNVVLEMVRFGSRELHKRILKEYNRMMSAGIFEESWYCTIFQMLPKSGDLSDALNWRPIAILPILYKIFSKMIYTRINGILNFHQSDEQIGFRSGFRIEDAFLVFESIVEMSLEYNVDLWIISIDLRNTFDQIEHVALFDAMREHQVPEAYIHLIGALYSNQSGKVDNSDHFEIRRGVKQGDVISALLFNCALDIAFYRWKQRLGDHGILMSNGRRMTNIRYADDILLYRKSLQEVCVMLEMLLQELQIIGLSMNTKRRRYYQRILINAMLNHLLSKLRASS